MGYLPQDECRKRLKDVQKLLVRHDLDIALVYYDEFNIGNGWYMTGWCPQFEAGAVLVPREGDPMILGGPESEPYAKLDSAWKETRNFPVFMVPDEEYPNATIIDFVQLFAELKAKFGGVKRAGLVGGDRMPAGCYRQIVEGFKGVQLVDITQDFVELRYIKSAWEVQQIRKSFQLADEAYEAMKAAIKPGVTEIEVAAAGEYAARKGGANRFGFGTIVGSGERSNAVVATASDRKLRSGETILFGLSPKFQGYAGVMGDTIPVNGKWTAGQKECMKRLKEAFQLTKAQLVPGRIGRQIDAPARDSFRKHDLFKFLVCPFAHTIGLHEAESPFFGPESDSEIKPGMTVCIDVSFFGHPEWHGARIETGYEITKSGPVPLSPKMDALFCKD